MRLYGRFVLLRGGLINPLDRFFRGAIPRDRALRHSPPGRPDWQGLTDIRCAGDTGMTVLVHPGKATVCAHPSRYEPLRRPLATLGR